jgi:cytochrome P450
MFRVTTQKQHHRTPPGPPGPASLFSAVNIQRDALGFTQNIWQLYGDVVRIQVLLKPATVLFHPDHVQHILQANHFNYDKHIPLIRAVKALLGNGLFTNDGSSWLQQRRLIQPIFHRKMLSRFGDIMTRSTLHTLEEWKNVADGEQPLNIPDDMARLTLRITTQSLFSVDSVEEAENIRKTFTEVWQPFSDYVNLPIPPLLVPTPRNRRIQQAAQVLNQIIYTMITKYRKAPPETTDLLSLLLNAQSEAGEQMDDQQVRDELVTMFIAGHETSAHTLSWIWYVLSQYPEVEQRLHAEIDKVLQGMPPTVEHLPQLTYTQRVVNETLRLFPPTFSIVRHAIDDDDVGAYRIPRNSIVFLTPFFTQRHPAFWPDPLRFDPDRFTPELAAKRHKFAYFPFGSGPRICIGNNFALMELSLIVATIAQQYRLRLVPNHPVEPWVTLIMRPRYGLPMTLHPR